jgi:hypothetical protein
LSNAIELFVPTAPPVQSAANIKARAFNFLANKLIKHALLFSCAELIAAFAHIPSSNANLEAGTICSTLSAFFDVKNLIGLGFRDNQGGVLLPWASTWTWQPVHLECTSSPSVLPLTHFRLIVVFSFRA